MPYEDEYELIPRKDFLELKTQVDQLKKNKDVQETAPDELTNKELYYSVNKLQETIETLVHIFKQARADMSKEEEGPNMEKMLGPFLSKIDDVIDQNKKIAKGIIALSDSFNDQLSKIESDITSAMDRKLALLKQDIRGPPRVEAYESGQAPAPAPVDPIPPAEPNPFNQAEPPQSPPPTGGPGVPPPIPPPHPPNPTAERKKLF